MKGVGYWILFALIASFFIPSLAISQEELKGLVLYYSFDEVAGDKVKDLSPSKKDGTLIKGPQLVPGKFGKGLQFGGSASGQYVDVGYHKELEADNAVTVMAWIFPVWIAPAPACCMQVYGFGVHGGCGGRVQHGLFTEDGLKARFETVGARLDVLAPLPDPKKWIHVAVTFEDGAGKIYYDGKKIAEGAAGKVLAKSNEPLFIAADCERVPQYIFNGTIDEFRMFKRALSEKEVNLHMNKGADVLAVDAKGKLATSWGWLKSAREIRN